MAEDTDIKNHEFQLNPGSSQLGEHVLFIAGWVDSELVIEIKKGGKEGRVAPKIKYNQVLKGLHGPYKIPSLGLMVRGLECMTGLGT